MTDEPENLTLKQLALLRSEIQTGFETTNSKIGFIAQTLVGLQKQMYDMQKQMNDMQNDIQGLKNNVAVLAVALDEHTHRLDRIEKHLGLVDAGKPH